MSNDHLSMEEFFISTNSLRIHMQQFIKVLAQKFGLLGQELVFVMVIDHLGTTTVSDLAKELSMKQANVSKMIFSLEKQGFIIKTKDVVDTRSYILQLSPSALAMKLTIEEGMKDRYKKHLDTIDVPIMQQGVRELIKFISIFEEGF